MERRSSKDWRGLIEKLLEAAERMKLSEVLLFTAEHRVAAINLYTKLGFKQKNSEIYILKREKKKTSLNKPL